MVEILVFDGKSRPQTILVETQNDAQQDCGQPGGIRMPSAQRGVVDRKHLPPEVHQRVNEKRRPQIVIPLGEHPAEQDAPGSRNGQNSENFGDACRLIDVQQGKDHRKARCASRGQSADTLHRLRPSGSAGEAREGSGPSACGDASRRRPDP